ncbi:hypothetical protein DL93DRAFT_2163100 [Clavulina sp. PMI_390]|nr:hypothetical protein DL93DRAFT_2163100 [Clavulina sp. PMI_390]
MAPAVNYEPRDLEEGPSIPALNPPPQNIPQPPTTTTALVPRFPPLSSLPHEVVRLLKAFALLTQFLLLHLQRTCEDGLHRILPSSERGHPNKSHLPQFVERLPSGSDPPNFSSEELRRAVVESFASHPPPGQRHLHVDERTPLLSAPASSTAPPTFDQEGLRSNLLLIMDPAPNPDPLSPRSPLIVLEPANDPSSSSDFAFPEASAAVPGLSPQPSSDESSSSSACSTPSNSSFTMLRPALRVRSPAASAPASPRSALLKLGFATEMLDGWRTGRSTPGLKSVRFNVDANETHFFEYAANEEHQTKSLKSPSEALGKWKKRNGTIVWQDGPERPRRSSSGSAAHDAEAEEEAYSRALFGRSLPGRILHSLLLGSRPPSLPSSSSSPTTERRYGGNSWADEGRWRDGMF